MFGLLAFAAALTAQPSITIYVVEQPGLCVGSRISELRAQRANRETDRLIREYEAKGYKVKVVPIIEGGIRMSEPNTSPVVYRYFC